MVLLGRIASAALVVSLAACGTEAPSATLARNIATAAEPFPIVQAAPVLPLVTNLETMRTDLPAFALRGVSDREVSVERALSFESDSPIVPAEQVDRLALLQAYLRDNPSVGVRIEGYYDLTRPPDAADLALNRAQALERALLTDMGVQNAISAVAAPHPQAGNAQAAIIFIGAQSLGLLRPAVLEPPSAAPSGGRRH